MPYNNYNAIQYNATSSIANYESIVINENIFLNFKSNIWFGKYNYTYSIERKKSMGTGRELDIFLNKLDPSYIAEKYYMKNFIYDSEKNNNNKIKYSEGTIYLGSEKSSGNSFQGKIDI